MKKTQDFRRVWIRYLFPGRHDVLFALSRDCLDPSYWGTIRYYIKTLQYCIIRFNTILYHAIQYDIVSFNSKVYHMRRYHIVKWYNTILLDYILQLNENLSWFNCKQFNIQTCFELLNNPSKCPSIRITKIKIRSNTTCTFLLHTIVLFTVHV